MFQQLNLGSVRCSIFRAKSLARFDQPGADLERNRAAWDRLPSLVQCDRNYFHYSGLSAFPVTLPTMYKTNRVPARFSVVSVQGSELPEVQPVASVLSLLGHIPVRSQALDRPILDLNYPIRSQG